LLDLTRPRLAVLLGALALGGCVDDRHLTPAAAAFDTHGGYGDDGSGGGGGAQQATAPPSPGDLIDGCADLDTDGVADCDATLVENASFSSDVSGWFAAGDTKLSWSRKNALDDDGSGSAKLTDASPAAAAPRASAFQCVPVDGSSLIVAWANAFVEASNDSDEPAQAELELTFVDGDDCSGATSGYFETPPTRVTGGWAVVQAGALAPASTHSVAVALVGIKAPDAGDLAVYFDNIMVKAVPTP
jgi:hypothetical protein